MPLPEEEGAKTPPASDECHTARETKKKKDEDEATPASPAAGNDAKHRMKQIAKDKKQQPSQGLAEYASPVASTPEKSDREKKNAASTTPDKSEKKGKKDEDRRMSNPSSNDSKDSNTPQPADALKVADPNGNAFVREINTYAWYHGLMPREEIEEQLQNEGDFLLRRTDVEGKTKYAISVLSDKQCRHVLLVWKKDKELWALNGRKEKTIMDLVKYFTASKQSVMKGASAILVTPKSRPDFYILHENIELGKRLGGGAFGDVFIGYYTHQSMKITVAVKRLKGAMTKEDRSTFVKEAKTMRPLNHENIVQLWGVAPQEEPMMIVLELAAGGVLKNHLEKNPQLKWGHITRYATDAARGMAYLASKKIIHRDIAARNCLLGARDEVKISDFGLSESNKDILKVDLLKKMPMKWLAPEVIRTGTFSTKSDVWAFGVMMWELYNHCKSDPFPGLKSPEIREKIMSGKQPLFVPDSVPKPVKKVIGLCFKQNVDKRSDFDEILAKLSKVKIKD